MREPRIDRLAEVLVQYSTGVKRGELVSMVGSPITEPLILALYREVLKAGGHPMVVMEPEACAEILYREGSQKQLAFVSPLELREVEAVNVTIHCFACQNTRALSRIDPARQAARSRARRPLMDAFLQRAAEKSLRWVATQFPCQAAAQEAETSLDDYADFVFTAGMLDKDDPASAWRALSRQQARLVGFLQDIHELRFCTDAGTDLRVGVAGRTWINCDGHENFPDGEVFTGPIEDGTDGIIVFDLPSVHGGREVDGVRLVFRHGRVVEASARKGEEFLVRMLDQDPGARVLGEVALGCNYAISRHTRNTLFDEKIGGTFHVALGAAYPESGGRNQSALHWDMVCDLRRGGSVSADGQVINEKGKFVNRGWPE